MSTDLASDQLPVTQRTAEETRRAQISICDYAWRQTGSMPDAVPLAAELIDELGLNGRPMRSTKHGSHITPARVSASPPRSPHPGGSDQEGS